MDSFYQKLVAELRDDPLGRGYAGMTNDQVAGSLNTTDRTLVFQRFGSFRTLAGVLDDAEYSAVKSMLAQIAQQNAKVADMVELLRLPCDERGATGGMDFGDPQVRAFVQALPDPPITATIKSKVLAIAERRISRAEELGLGRVGPHHVAYARTL